MCLSRHGITLAILAVVTLASTGFASAQDGDGSIGFYGAPDAGPAPIEVHFHPIGDESLINSVTKWAWDFGDGATSDETYTSHQYTSDGAYTVTLTVTLSDGRTQKATRADYIKVAAGAKPTEDEDEPATEIAAEEPEPEGPVEIEVGPRDGSRGGANGAVFIHHSCGENWLNGGLHRALLAKPYIDDRNDITYGTELNPDSGRPRSLGSPAGDLTDMQHWILWFNDYLGRVQAHGGQNRIILFKSCFPNSHVDDVGTEPGDPFSDWHCIANYKAVYRHPGGSGKTYAHDGHTYRALQDVFAQHPDTLFIPVTAPPECWAETDKPIAANARAFNTWLKDEWLPAYVRATGLHNVAVFDWFDLLACPASDSSHPNQLRSEYGGGAGDSHPNSAANTRSTQVFAGFIDEAWQAFDK
ncbi:MAG: PKD domain-containing protein [bacterium]|nr:PKD domain-containing protein [bacterium]